MVAGTTEANRDRADLATIAVDAGWYLADADLTRSNLERANLSADTTTATQGRRVDIVDGHSGFRLAVVRSSDPLLDVIPTGAEGTDWDKAVFDALMDSPTHDQ
ncbi:hypothetical protein [Nocardia nepalensis]|uniref:hypothetical protein n=1 Tax=Nocardia nepalensis TaxID=3375448 RepID=UPI003B6724DA